jgi:hypothetical protein
MLNRRVSHRGRKDYFPVPEEIADVRPIIMMKLTNLPFPLFGPAPTADSSRERPGTIVELRGIIFQCDASSLLGDILIRPAEALDLWFAGFEQRPWWRGAIDPGFKSTLGMHAGLHVVLEDGRHFVVEQLTGGWREWLINGLHWTPLEAFQRREKRAAGGWDATVPVEEFRQVDEYAKKDALARLNDLQGRPFLREDCTGFIGRVFGPKRRIFADSPILRAFGFDLRSGEPALPLLRRDAVLKPEAEERLHAEVLRSLPEPRADTVSMSLRQLHHRLLILGAVTAAIALLAPPGLCARAARRVVKYRPFR